MQARALLRALAAHCTGLALAGTPARAQTHTCAASPRRRSPSAPASGAAQRADRSSHPPWRLRDERPRRRGRPLGGHAHSDPPRARPPRRPRRRARPSGTRACRRRPTRRAPAHGGGRRLRPRRPLGVLHPRGVRRSGLADAGQLRRRRSHAHPAPGAEAVRAGGVDPLAPRSDLHRPAPPARRPRRPHPPPAGRRPSPPASPHPPSGAAHHALAKDRALRSGRHPHRSRRELSPLGRGVRRPLRHHANGAPGGRSPLRRTPGPLLRRAEGRPWHHRASLVALHAQYRRRTAELVPHRPQVCTAIRSLREEGWRLGVVTNGDPATQRLKLRRARLDGLFEAVVISGEYGIRKPDPDLYRIALDALDTDSGAMIGDDLDADIAGGARAGLHSVWVSGGRDLPAAGPVPDHTVRDVVDAVKLLREHAHAPLPASA
ncbi:HAD family hydrolase [Streptomyces sp. NPDC091027]|uniref:HAD family hydrolase n=1 Tax=Streptomyces sp. NPDC091027 TaxID=3365971 RepID=UPI0038053BAC